jgi:hypothetical protein
VFREALKALEEKKKEARTLLKQGMDPKTVAEKTGLDIFQISGIVGRLAQLDKASKKPQGGSRGGPEGAQRGPGGSSKGSGGASEDLGRDSEGGVGVLPGSTGEKERTGGPGGPLEGARGGPEGSEGERALERELWVKATPVIRKVILNPKVYLYYDYIKTKYGYKGDIGDFLYDCVEDFFKSRSITIKVVEEEEVKG